MSISVIVGPPNSGRAGVIRERLEAALPSEPVLVVPTADDSARFERELCAGGGALLGASITTFHRLRDEVAGATGAPVRPLLSDAQRLALVRAAVADADLRLLAASARQPGFAPAAERLIGELQAALVAPDQLARAAVEIDGGDYEAELARLYAGYVKRRDGAGRDDAHSAAITVARSLRGHPEAWGLRPVLDYGFDDLAAELPFDPTYTASATLRGLDRGLFALPDSPIEADGGLALLECAGERAEAEALGGEIAQLLAGGVAPDDIVIVLRRPDARGSLYHQVLADLGIPVAVEASVPLPHTAVGRGIVALARCSESDAGTQDLLAFLRATPGATSQSIADWAERQIRRGGLETADEAIAGWKNPPGALARVRGAREPAAWLRVLAAEARLLAEDPHREREPIDGAVSPGDGGVPFDPLEARAAEVAAATLEELAALDELPGCAVARSHRGAGARAQPLPRARGACAPPLRGIAPGRRVSRSGRRRSAP